MIFFVLQFQSEDGAPLSPSPLSSQASSIDHLLAAVNEFGSREDLGLRGSQADITVSPTPQHNAKKKRKVGFSLLASPLSFQKYMLVIIIL